MNKQIYNTGGPTLFLVFQLWGYQKKKSQGWVQGIQLKKLGKCKEKESTEGDTGLVTG